MSRGTTQNTYEAADKYTDDTTGQTTVWHLAIKAKTSTDDTSLPRVLSKHLFEACSLHSVDFSGINLTGTIFGKDTYLYNLNFFNKDLTTVTFSPECKVRSQGSDRTTIQPFNLTNAKVTNEQLLLFIKRGVLDINQINWDIQSEEVQANKYNYIALCQVMYASSDHSAASPEGPFTLEAFRASFRPCDRHGRSKIQQLLNHCDPKKQSQSKHYTRIDIDAPFPAGKTLALADIVYTLEQIRIRRDISATPSSGIGERIPTIQNITYHQRQLDDQHMPVEAFNSCTYSRSSLRNITYGQPTTSYNHCEFSHSTIAPLAIESGESAQRSTFLRFDQCTFNKSTVIESTESISAKLQFTDSRFKAAKLHGDFNRSSFSNPYLSEVSSDPKPCTFKNSELKGSFRGASFVGAALSDSTLEGDFANADFRGANLTNCDLSKMTFNKDTFAGATLKNCTVGGHQRIMYFMVVCQQDIRQLNWKKMGVDSAPYVALQALYQHSKMPKVKQAAMFTHLICDASKHVKPLTGIEAALKAEGKKHHTRFVPDLFLPHAQRNRYFRALKELDMPKPAPTRFSA
ncbi:MAG: pentapeptide repeat-containing protein [Coxiellaceae bacterium]|nr:pentapeptide repeat-containing protein [Coxiellaceae bacterium]